MRHQVRIRLYPLVQEAVENGIAYGVHRVFKYRDGPIDEDDLVGNADAIVDAVMNELCELIVFDEEPDA